MARGASKTVLIAEDDPDIIRILKFYLTGSGFRVVAATDGLDALELMRGEEVSVALVDIMMPRMNGYDFIREVRRFSSVPIIIVSARNMAADKVCGLDIGADGYITKPFDAMEVTAYVRAVLRRAEGAGAASVLRAGDLVLDPRGLSLMKAGVPVPLTAAELRIVAQLMSEPGRVFSKEQLYACACGGDEASAVGCEASVMVHISNIRAKIEDDPSHPRHIRTVRGMGYRLDA